VRARSRKVAFARSRAKELAIGVAGPSEDVGVALVELLAYAGQVLSEYQDELADEAYLESDWNEEARRLRIRLDPPADSRLCLIADRRRVYVVTVGRATTEARLVFGDGAVGTRPSGSEKVTARYRRGAGGAGNLTLSGLHLQKPFVVLVSGSARTFTASSSD
jgi:hypothetical protein